MKESGRPIPCEELPSLLMHFPTGGRADDRFWLHGQCSHDHCMTPHPHATPLFLFSPNPTSSSSSHRVPHWQPPTNIQQASSCPPPFPSAACISEHSSPPSLGQRHYPTHLTLLRLHRPPIHLGAPPCFRASPTCCASFSCTPSAADLSALHQMGDIIDNSLGVTFGLSTLTAAGIGQIFSDVSGV